MGRAPCCDKANVKRGPWSPEEDETLRTYLHKHGTIAGNWISLPHKAGLKRCGKSCRLRWLNYLRPNIKHGGFTPEEDNIIYTLYQTLGSRWSVIASQLHGRTDNDVKNYWNTKLKKKVLLHQIPSPSPPLPSPPPPPTFTSNMKAEPVETDSLIHCYGFSVAPTMASSSSVTMENGSSNSISSSLVHWPNEEEDVAVLLAEFGFGSSLNDLLTGYGFSQVN
ncbi:hypothetical protein J5N97_019365 [Dioscorea zingiberensis]|uniref:Uncharacterized protein n=1 Tax=Dioscorea zingiberensis TaxID=325984 RepID=A0A9D5CDQ6_9LILI|nr:hypothetical protein J5N97_019365 [Dioscorea zingiberensis]